MMGVPVMPSLLRRRRGDDGGLPHIIPEPVPYKLSHSRENNRAHWPTAGGEQGSSTDIAPGLPECRTGSGATTR